ncbi:MAG: VanZ family protein, partial [Thiotrichales bacterium]|nr:VanZ family protein [Thiotrichales bacterium]
MKPGMLLAILSLIALVFTFKGQFNPYIARSIHELWNLGHVAAFFLWTLLILGFSTRLQKTGFVYQVLICILFALGAGALIEYLQSFLGREASLHDLGNNVLGSLLAVIGRNIYLRALKNTAGVLLIAVSLVLLLGLNHRVLIYLYDEYQARRQFPVLVDFSTVYEEKRIVGNAVRTIRG